MVNEEINQVYVSELLKNKAPNFFNQLRKILRSSLSELAYTNDIWCRDYMPIQINESTFLKYRYDPDYLKSKKDCTSRTNVNEVWNWFIKQRPKTFKYKPSTLVLDGGNVVKHKDKVILTDKVFTENFDLYVSQKNKLDQKHKDRIIETIKNDLEVNEVIIVPRLSQDWLGHTDGMVRFLNEKEVLVSNFDFLSEDPEASNYLKKQIQQFYTILEIEHNLVLHKVPYYEYPDDKYDGHSTANGCYINYLQADRFVLLPQFGKPNEDKEALNRFEQIFKPKGMQVIPIDATEVSRFQGVINCVTWEIKL